MNDLTRLLQALADETRVDMLALLLQHEELCVCDFMHTLEVTQSKASRHLRYLYNAGLVQDRRSNVWIYYRISPKLQRKQKALLNSVINCLDEKRMKALNSKLEEWKQEQSRCAPVKVRNAGRKTEVAL